MTDIQLLEASHDFYLEGRERMDAGDLNLAVVAFEASIAAYPHFKALELLGECHMRLRYYKSAIVPLAAATTLNRQSRAPSLLAEAFERLGEFSDAREFAQLALLRAREIGELATSSLASAPTSRSGMRVSQTFRGYNG